MGLVEWFIGEYFSWRFTPLKVDVHLNQTSFVANLVEQFCRDTWEPTPTATPYRLSVPIDSIAASSDDDDSPSQIRRTEAYQSLIGSIRWLATATRPDLAPVHSFLSSYNIKPSSGHMKAALHVLHYIHSTRNYDIHLYHRTQILFTPLCTFRTLPTLRPTRTQSRLLLPIHPCLLRIVMLAGALRWVRLFAAAPSSHFSNVAV